jgi:DNA-binding NarL/FixJ family response regulator
VHGLARGLSYKQIATELGLSQSTVRTHLHNVYGKLGARDRAQAVLIAVKHRWWGIGSGATGAWKRR